MSSGHLVSILGWLMAISNLTYPKLNSYPSPRNPVHVPLTALPVTVDGNSFQFLKPKTVGFFFAYRLLSHPICQNIFRSNGWVSQETVTIVQQNSMYVARSRLQTSTSGWLEAKGIQQQGQAGAAIMKGVSGCQGPATESGMCKPRPEVSLTETQVQGARQVPN